jgi:class 3 adenylate cyclase/putative methionine-R-sulfoxide reductase with GAF domain/HAMP domain-containing protein
MKADVDQKGGGLKADLTDRSGVPPSGVGASIVRSRLFFKYMLLFVMVVVLALVANGGFEVWFSYQEHKNSLIDIQEQQAAAAADKIEEFITQIESQVGWTIQLPWTDDTLVQRRFDALRLLRQVPAITELAQIDAAGHEQLKVSRMTMDVVDSGIDYSHKPEFTQAVAHKVYYGPVYFHQESEPYMMLSLAGTRPRTGVSIAQVNLTLIWDVVSKIKVGEHGRAYVVDSDGRLIAHPDINLVLRNTDMSRLTQVRGARAGSATEAVQEADDIGGHKVLTAYAPVHPLGWFVFVETPVEEAYAPLYRSILRTGYVLLGALALAFIAGMFLAGRMVVPIQALRAGAARIGSGDLGQRIMIKSGDEVEALANQFNDMAGKLQESYADLEKKVEQRTAELSESLEQQTATADVLKVISQSAFDLRAVLQTLIESAARFCVADKAHIIREKDGTFYTAETYGYSREFMGYIKNIPIKAERGSAAGRALLEGRVIHITDVKADSEYAFVEARRLGNYRTILCVPMLREGVPIGLLGLTRSEVQPFTDKQIELVTIFADQAAIAIENARLLNELRESLEQQTATAEVLGVISSSPAELEPVFQAILANATRLCSATFGGLSLYDGEVLRYAAHYNIPPGYTDFRLRERLWRPNPRSGMAEVIRTKQPVQINDLRTSPPYHEGDPTVRALADEGGARTLILIPMLKDDKLIGVVAIYRDEVRPFTDKQIALVQNFAAQAVIAIENTRLLSELHQRTEEVVKLNQQLEQRVADQVGEIERMSKLRRFLPPQVADLIVASGTEKQLESHRREITALFCDLRGYTGFSETSAPEDVMALLREYHAAIGEITIKYSGTLERFAGDGVMVIFNDPVPVENPALQAVLMALEMRTAIEALIEKWRRLGHDLGFGVGIAHGFATLGTIGFEGRFDYAAIGTVSNVASRLCDEARPGQILISTRVRQAVEKAVTVEPVGEFTLKGIRRPMMTFNVLEPLPSKPN